MEMVGKYDIVALVRESTPGLGSLFCIMYIPGVHIVQSASAGDVWKGFSCVWIME